MSRTARPSQPAGGQSSMRVSCNEQRRPQEQKHSSLRTSQPTPRRGDRGHVSTSYIEDPRASNVRPRHSSSQQDGSRRRDEAQRAPVHPPSRQSRPQPMHDDRHVPRGDRHYGRATSNRREDPAAPRLSARTSEMKNRTAQSASRGSLHPAPSRGASERRRLDPAGKSTSRSCLTEADWQAAVNHSKIDIRSNRTLPGEELPSPICNAWIDAYDQNEEPLLVFMPLSSRSQTRHSAPLSARRASKEVLQPPCHGGRAHRRGYQEDWTLSEKGHAERSSGGYAERSSGFPASQDRKYAKHSAVPEKEAVKSEAVKSHKSYGHARAAHPGSMGSSATTSARGSVIESVADLWETSSVDSLPLGAEWFNFMHGH